MFEGVVLSRAGERLYKVVVQAILWVIWIERKQRVFEDVETKMRILITIVKELAWNWCLDFTEVTCFRFDVIMLDWARVVVNV
ncbi:hypothetical protein ACHQM5_008937 [Ranunculus cassubicifolius]